MVGDDANYSLSKCTTSGINCTKNATSVTSTVGMLRLGEQLSGQFNVHQNNTDYWTLTPNSSFNVWEISYHGDANGISPTDADGVRPSANLKPTIKITSGSGTKQDPFTVSS